MGNDDLQRKTLSNFRRKKKKSPNVLRKAKSQLRINKKKLLDVLLGKIKY
jgi:hypothetical protein